MSMLNSFNKYLNNFRNNMNRKPGTRTLAQSVYKGRQCSNVKIFHDSNKAVDVNTQIGNTVQVILAFKYGKQQIWK